MPDDHSEVEPPLPIPNRTVKRLCADDSEHSLVKVGHCQANLSRHRPLEQSLKGFLLFVDRLFVDRFLVDRFMLGFTSRGLHRVSACTRVSAGTFDSDSAVQ